MDKASRYITLVAVARQEEETLKRKIKENWILRFGAPKEIHVDCGKTFESTGIKFCYVSQVPITIIQMVW